MRFLVICALIAGCTRDVATHEPGVEVPAPKPVPPVPPKPAPTPPAPVAKIAALEVRELGILCAIDTAGGRKCSKVTWDWQGNGFSAAPTKEDPAADEYLDGGKKCTYRDRTLACEGAAAIANVRFRFGAYYSYFEKPDGVSWFQHVKEGTADLHAMTGVGTIAQLAVGWRVACSLGTDGAVWCWSDPKKPKKIATPPEVAAIVIQDPFELCVRTKAGDVHCTPPFVGTDSLACSKTSIACGTGNAENPRLTTSFDPLAMIARPLAKLEVPRAPQLLRDDDHMYAICMEVWMLNPLSVGGCSSDPETGAVNCFATCGKRWRRYSVVGLPPAAQIAPDTDGGVAIARDHQVWTWARPETEGCAPVDVRATPRKDLPALTSMVEMLMVQNGPTTWDRLHCGITPDGGARCWAVQQVGWKRPATTYAAFDPFAYKSPGTKP